MNFSKQLENLVYTTPVVNQSQAATSPTEKKNKEQNKKDMLNELGLAIKRR